MNLFLFAILFLASVSVLITEAFPARDQDGVDGSEPQLANPSASWPSAPTLNNAIGPDYSNVKYPKPHKGNSIFQPHGRKKSRIRQHRPQRVAHAGPLHRASKHKRLDRGKARKRSLYRRNKWTVMKKRTRRGRKQRHRRHRRPVPNGNGGHLGVASELNGTNNATNVQLVPNQDPSTQQLGGFDPQLVMGEQELQLEPEPESEATLIDENIEPTPELAGLMSEAELTDGELITTTPPEEPPLSSPQLVSAQTEAPTSQPEPLQPVPPPLALPPSLSPEHTKLYQLLGIAVQASADDIRKAYKKAAFSLHPDRNADPYATLQFQEMKEAYEVLSNPAKREKYDQGGMEEVAKWSYGDAMDVVGTE